MSSSHKLPMLIDRDHGRIINTLCLHFLNLVIAAFSQAYERVVLSAFHLIMLVGEFSWTSFEVKTGSISRIFKHER